MVQLGRGDVKSRKVPGRRRVLQLLRERGSRTAGELADQFELSKPFLREPQGFARPRSTSAKQAAAEVRGILEESDMLCESPVAVRQRFFVTDEAAHFGQLGQQFLGRPIHSVDRVNGR